MHFSGLFLSLLPFISLITALPQPETSLEDRELLDIPIISDVLVALDDLVGGKILGDIVSYLLLNPLTSAKFPGLTTVLQSAQDKNVTCEEFNRGLLSAIQLHPAFITAHNELDPDLQEKVTEFISGKSASSIIGKRGFYIPPSPAAKQHFKRMEESGTTPISRRWLNAKRDTSPVIYEDTSNSTSPMTVYVAAEFENWGLTVSNTPAYTFVPTKVKGLQNLITWAKTKKLRVRAAGYRHTWGDMYSETDHVFVSMLDTKTATTVPDPSSILPNAASNAANEFKQIELASEDVSGSGGKKRLVRLGAAVTNEEFRRWAIANNAWTVPVNVVMVEITYGGSNAPICHGGGIQHKTLSDLVRQVEYVDVNGVHQTVSDPDQLKAAAGAFGLLGVVTHITLELDSMTYANMQPAKPEIGLTIPPPEGYTVPKAIRETYTDAQLEEARLDWISKAENSYYSEYFWFPYQDRSFVNVWNNTEDSTGAIDYPSAPDQFNQWIQGWLGGVINDDLLFRAFPGHWQAVILSTAAMLGLPDSDVKTYLIDAIHFRRGVQNMRVRDIELQIPIPALADDPTKPDWTVVQKAWWDAIEIVYADDSAPMRIALELRIMGDSDIIMAPQTRNSFGTASIEVLTTMPAADDGSWAPFAQKIADKWMSYTTQDGALINTRPHWAKEWQGMTINGTDWKQYLKDVSYKDEIPQFLNVLGEIGAEQGWELKDLKERFSNPFLDDMFFE
ncbi:uncharacterized protein H6S33_004172 [Morchella sextelata]|uniref:uncharacterized protein n=1 Tax=Morchella sextelata TaxID=1174677 RepID=UPI001D05597A|nr:uncharacterized protein H6S33_004172 [Morchella sextelata]KAH0605715.1 hypothetical protein H6S33_004172 [Morchella sextelata]